MVMTSCQEKRKERNRRATMFKLTFSFTPQSFLGGFKYYCFCDDCLCKVTLPVSKGSGNISEKHFIVKDSSDSSGISCGPWTETSAVEPSWFRQLPELHWRIGRSCQRCWVLISIFFLLTEEDAHVYQQLSAFFKKNHAAQSLDVSIVL